MRCFKLLGERVMACDFDRQVAEWQIRAAILNRFIRLGTPTTVAMPHFRLGSGELRAQLIYVSKPPEDIIELNDGRFLILKFAVDRTAQNNKRSLARLTKKVR